MQRRRGEALLRRRADPSHAIGACTAATNPGCFHDYFFVVSAQVGPRRDGLCGLQRYKTLSTTVTFLANQSLAKSDSGPKQRLFCLRCYC